MLDRGAQDRARVSAEEPYEVAYFAKKHGISEAKALEIIRQNDVMWRYLAAFAYATVALSTVAALAFLLSVFAENSIGPIVSTISIVIVFTLLSEMQIPLYDRTIKPFLFTSHMLAWKGFFYTKVDAGGSASANAAGNEGSYLAVLDFLGRSAGAAR